MPRPLRRDRPRHQSGTFGRLEPFTAQWTFIDAVQLHSEYVRKWKVGFRNDHKARHGEKNSGFPFITARFHIFHAELRKCFKYLNSFPIQHTHGVDQVVFVRKPELEFGLFGVVLEKQEAPEGLLRILSLKLGDDVAELLAEVLFLALVSGPIFREDLRLVLIALNKHVTNGFLEYLR